VYDFFGSANPTGTCRSTKHVRHNTRATLFINSPHPQPHWLPANRQRPKLAHHAPLRMHLLAAALRTAQRLTRLLDRHRHPATAIRR